MSFDFNNINNNSKIIEAVELKLKIELACVYSYAQPKSKSYIKKYFIDIITKHFPGKILFTKEINPEKTKEKQGKFWMIVETSVNYIKDITELYQELTDIISTLRTCTSVATRIIPNLCTLTQTNNVITNILNIDNEFNKYIKKQFHYLYFTNMRINKVNLSPDLAFSSPIYFNNCEINDIKFNPGINHMMYPNLIKQINVDFETREKTNYTT